MRFAIDIPHFGPFSDPLLMAELAHEAEEAGWDGFFLWDHLNFFLEHPSEPLEAADPWIELAAIAMRTSRIKIGTVVTPLPRRRPWKLARETVTLDRLSGGRLILGIGLGSTYYGEYDRFGEDPDARVRGEKLDEGLDILTRLWSGEKVSYEGQHYQLSEVQFLPKPLQQPRIPIWIAGNWPNKKPFRRAARFDGVYPQMPSRPLAPADFREILAYIQEHRTEDTPYDALAFGKTSGLNTPDEIAHLNAFVAAGATWWLEHIDPDQTTEQVRKRIQQGPPRL